MIEGFPKGFRCPNCFGELWRDHHDRWTCARCDREWNVGATWAIFDASQAEGSGREKGDE